MGSNADSFRQLAAEMVLELSERMGDLTDEEAQPLIAWALGQADAAVQNLLALNQGSCVQPPGEPGERLAAMLKPVAQAVTIINDWIADRDALSPQEINEKLGLLQQLSRQLPRPPISGAMDLALRVPIRETGLSNTDLIHAVLKLLGGPPPTGAEEPASLRGVDDQATT